MKKKCVLKSVRIERIELSNVKCERRHEQLPQNGKKKKTQNKTHKMV